MNIIGFSPGEGVKAMNRNNRTNQADRSDCNWLIQSEKVQVFFLDNPT